MFRLQQNRKKTVNRKITLQHTFNDSIKLSFKKPIKVKNFSIKALRAING